MAKQPTTFDEWYVKSSYQQFVQSEGAPLYEGSALEDLATLPLAAWERRGGKVAYTRLGNHENNNLQIVEIPAKGELKPERHIYDAIMNSRVVTSALPWSSIPSLINSTNGLA